MHFDFLSRRGIDKGQRLVILGVSDVDWNPPQSGSQALILEWLRICVIISDFPLPGVPVSNRTRGVYIY